MADPQYDLIIENGRVVSPTSDEIGILASEFGVTSFKIYDGANVLGEPGGQFLRRPYQ